MASPNSIIVLQARTSSKRLPAKVLLPIAGMPLVILAAKRAANRGKKIIIATSNQSSDDYLAKLAFDHGIACFRGSMDNVLERFVMALSAYDDNTLVFRLTADNVFPDGALLDKFENFFLTQKLDYAICNGEPSGLPYGVSVELMRLKHLRQAANEVTSDEDKEHVTLYLKRKFGLTYYTEYKDLQMSQYRCTIDNFDDYIYVQNVFKNVKDSINTSIPQLLKIMETSFPLVDIAQNNSSVFVLGTAQLGLKYGIANEKGQPSLAESTRLIKSAIQNGVKFIDTARAYGNSEKVVGQALADGWHERVSIGTKLSPLDNIAGEQSAECIKQAVSASVFQSLWELGKQQLELLMLHRSSQLTEWSGAVWDHLQNLKAQGLIKKLGVSVQNPQEFLLALSYTDVEHIQLPLNVLDWRWEEHLVKILEARKTRSLTIHARSALLQGLLPSTNNNHWLKANIKNFFEVQNWLAKAVYFCGRRSIADLCIAYVKSLSWIDGVVVGIESNEQLFENLNYFSTSNLLPSEIDYIINTRPVLANNALDPSLWRK